MNSPEIVNYFEEKTPTPRHSDVRVVRPIQDPEIEVNNNSLELEELIELYQSGERDLGVDTSFVRNCIDRANGDREIIKTIANFRKMILGSVKLTAGVYELMFNQLGMRDMSTCQKLDLTDLSLRLLNLQQAIIGGDLILNNTMIAGSNELKDGVGNMEEMEIQGSLIAEGAMFESNLYLRKTKIAKDMRTENLMTLRGLNQYGTVVEGNLNQSKLRVNFSFDQSCQEVKGESVQNEMRIRGNLSQVSRKVDKNNLQENCDIEGYTFQKKMITGGRHSQKGSITTWLDGEDVQAKGGFLEIKERGFWSKYFG